MMPDVRSLMGWLQEELDALGAAPAPRKAAARKPARTRKQPSRRKRPGTSKAKA